jgi:hypothetical protein
MKPFYSNIHSSATRWSPAVTRAGDAIVNMASFAARDQPPAAVCEERVRAADVFVLIAGFRCGSLVREQPEVSYTELEFEAAAAIPRLVFLLAEDVQGPAMVQDPLRVRQTAFRERRRHERITVTVGSPAELEMAVYQALSGGQRGSCPRRGRPHPKSPRPRRGPSRNPARCKNAVANVR